MCTTLFYLVKRHHFTHYNVIKIHVSDILMLRYMCRTIQLEVPCSGGGEQTLLIFPKIWKRLLKYAHPRNFLDFLHAVRGLFMQGLSLLITAMRLSLETLNLWESSQDHAIHLWMAPLRLFQGCRILRKYLQYLHRQWNT